MYCILVAGVPASGKSTMAAELSRRLNLPLLSKDTIKETLYDTVGFDSRAQKVRLGEAAFRIMIKAADECIAHGQSVILENNFETATNGELRDWLSRRRCPALTVMMTGDWAALHRRFAARNEPAAPGPRRQRPLPAEAGRGGPSRIRDAARGIYADVPCAGHGQAARARRMRDGRCDGPVPRQRGRGRGLRPPVDRDAQSLTPSFRQRLSVGR